MPACESGRVARDERLRGILLLAILKNSRKNTGSVDRLSWCLNGKIIVQKQRLVRHLIELVTEQCCLAVHMSKQELHLHELCATFFV